MCVVAVTAGGGNQNIEQKPTARIGSHFHCVLWVTARAPLLSLKPGKAFTVCLPIVSWQNNKKQKAEVTTVFSDCLTNCLAS